MDEDASKPDQTRNAIDDIDLEALGRYFLGEASSRDVEDIEARMAADPAVRSWVAYMRTALRHGSAVTNLPRPALAQEAARLRSMAGHLDNKVVVLPQPSVSVAGRRMAMFVGTISALAIIGLFTVGHTRHDFVTHDSQTYATTPGQRLSLTLPDGTHLTIGPDSRVRIPPSYASGDRTVDLEGEGYFTVVHDGAHPFAVRTRSGLIRDVGTVFGVREYGEDDGAHVAVEEGAVMAASHDCLGLARPTACELTMRGGEVGLISSRGAELQRGLDVSTVTGWMQGRLVFQDTPLLEVIRTLGRTFNLDIKVADSSLAQETVTGAFETESAALVLESITGVIGATYQQSGRTVVIRRKAVSHQLKPDSSVPPLKVARVRQDQE